MVGITGDEPVAKTTSSLIDDTSREDSKEAKNALTELGIEVVLEIGHGTIGVYIEDDPGSHGT